MLGVRRERQAKGWTLVDVSRKTGISPQTLSKIERGLYPIYPGWRKRLIDLFGVAADVLFMEVDCSALVDQRTGGGTKTRNSSEPSV